MGNMPSCNPWDDNGAMIDAHMTPNPSRETPHAETSLWRQNLITILRNSLIYKKEGDTSVTSRLPDGVLSLIVDYWGYNEALVMTGGNSGSSVTYPSAGCDIFDMDSRNLLHLVEMNSGRYHHSCVTLNGRVYVVGGISAPGQPCMTVDVLDLKTLRWRTICTLDIPRISTAAVAVPAFPSDGKAGSGIYEAPSSVFYITGGTDGEQFLRHVLRYNPETNMWSKLPRLLEGRRSHCMVYFNGYLIAIGGTNDQGELNSVELLDLDKKRFQKYMTRRYLNEYYTTRMSEEPHAQIYDIVYPEVPHFKWTWLPLASLNTVRSGATACVLDETLYVIGGHDGIKTLSSVETLDLSQLLHDGYASPTDEYQNTDTPFAMDHHGQKIPLPTPQVLPPIHERRWETGPSLLQARGGATAVVMEALGTILVCGGFNGVSYSGDSEMLTPPARKGSLLYREENYTRELLLQHVHSRFPIRVVKNRNQTTTNTGDVSDSGADVKVNRVFVDANGRKHGSLSDIIVVQDHFSVEDADKVNGDANTTEAATEQADTFNSEIPSPESGDLLQIPKHPVIIDPELSASPMIPASDLHALSESIGIIREPELMAENIFSPVANPETSALAAIASSPSPTPPVLSPAQSQTHADNVKNDVDNVDKPSETKQKELPAVSSIISTDSDDYSPGIDYNLWSPTASLSSMQFTHDLATYVNTFYNTEIIKNKHMQSSTIKESLVWKPGPYLRRAAHHASVVINPYHDLTFISGNLVAVPTIPDLDTLEGDGDDYEEDSVTKKDNDANNVAQEEKKAEEDDDEDDNTNQFASRLAQANIDKPSKKKSAASSSPLNGNGDASQRDASTTASIPMPSSETGKPSSLKHRKKSSKRVVSSLSTTLPLPAPSLSPSASLSPASSPSPSPVTSPIVSDINVNKSTKLVLTAHQPSPYSPMSPLRHDPMSPLPATVLRGKKSRNPESAVANAAPSPSASPDTTISPFHHGHLGNDGDMSVSHGHTGDTESVDSFVLSSDAQSNISRPDSAADVEKEEKKADVDVEVSAPHSNQQIDTNAGNTTNFFSVPQVTPIEASDNQAYATEPPVDELYAMFNAYDDPLAAESGGLAYQDPDIIISHEEIERQASQLRTSGISTPRVGFSKSLDDLENTRI